MDGAVFGREAELAEVEATLITASVAPGTKKHPSRGVSLEGRSVGEPAAPPARS